MPSVFISYSHDNRDPSHGEKVAGLAASLLESGLDVYFDQNRGNDEERVQWPIWMESKIGIADFVLLVCTELYLDKVQQRAAPNEGLGVCWEANIIYNYLYLAKLNTTKFLPVVFASEEKRYIPVPLAGANNFVLDSNQSFTQLYAYLTGQHRTLFPVQGSATAVIPQRTVKPLFSLKTGATTPVKSQPEPTIPAPELPIAAARLKLKEDIPPSPRQDIRGLDWYEECDAQHFLGRDEDSSRLLSMLLTQPVIRLIGPSGVGKSSLIRAGLLPKIREFGWRACVLRPFENPARRIPEQLSESLLISGSLFSTPFNAASLRAELSEALAAAGTKRLVLLLDQFEDIVSPSAGPDAVDSMRLWLRELWENAQSTPFLRAIVVYRTDADARLGRLWQEITGRSEGLPYLPVEGLSQEVAAKIIRQYAQERNWKIEISLLDITRQLALESLKLGCSGDIFPVYLQILLRQVSDTSSGKLTPELMQSLGGVSGLIVRFLEQSLVRLKARGGDWQHCGRILEALSRSSGTKSALSLETLTRECDLSRTMLVEMLTVLIQERLVRPIGHETYEIQHDRLASAVIDSMKDSDREAKQAREFLSAKTPLFESNRIPLSTAELVYFYRYRKRIHPSTRELSVLLASALNAIVNERREDWRSGSGVTLVSFAFWFSKLQSTDWRSIIVQVEQWCHSNENLATPSNWADAFAPTSFGEAEIASQIHDPAPSIRRLSAVWMRNLGIATYAPLLRQLASDEDGGVRIEAVKALAYFPNEQDLPLLRQLSNDKNRDVRVEVVKALACFQDEQDLPLLRQLAHDEYGKVRIEIAKALTRFRKEHAIPLLRLLIRDGEFSVRLEVIKTFAVFLDEQATPLLGRLIQDLLHKVSREGFTAKSSIDQVFPLGIGKSLLTLSPEQALPLLRYLAKGRYFKIQRGGIKTFFNLLLYRCIPMRNFLLKDAVTKVHLDALRALASLQPDEALPMLRNLSKASHAALALFTSLQPEEALPMLRKLSNHRSPYASLRAIELFASLRPKEAIPILRKLLKNKNCHVRVLTLDILVDLQLEGNSVLHEEDTFLLQDIAKNDDSFESYRAQWALEKLKSPVSKSDLIKNALSPEDNTSYKAIMKLESLPPEELEQLLDENEQSLSAGALAALDRVLYMPDWLKAGLPLWNE